MKYFVNHIKSWCSLSPPAREVWVEIMMEDGMEDYDSRLPRGRCGLKLYLLNSKIARLTSPPAREVWVEIYMACSARLTLLVASREGGVG